MSNTSDSGTPPSLDRLARLLAGVPRVLETEIHSDEDEDCIVFTYKNADGDTLPSVLWRNKGRAICELSLPVKEEISVASIIVANIYNSVSGQHGTFAKASKMSSGAKYLSLESHLSPKAGQYDDVIVEWLENFIDHVERFESTIGLALNRVGKDSTFLKGTGWDRVWEGVGLVLKGFTDYQRSKLP